MNSSDTPLLSGPHSPLAVPSGDTTDAASSAGEQWRAGFLVRAQGQMTGLRRSVPLIAADRKALLGELEQSLLALAREAAPRGFAAVAQLTSALAGLVQELRSSPPAFTPSTRHTLAQGIACLEDAIGRSRLVSTGRAPLAPNILVVDDDLFSRQAVRAALELAHLNCVELASPLMALATLGLNTFDLVFLDIHMPELEGFELCERMRKETDNCHTPVVFITGERHYADRSRSARSRAVDFISKPFPLVELAVKSICLLAAGRARASATPQTAP